MRAEAMRTLAVAMVLVLVASACGGGSDSPELEALREKVEALEAQMSTVALAPTTAVTPAITAKAVPTTLTASTPAEVFAAVSPSVVFIEVPDGTGSGVLLSSGYVVTNAHVVGHFPTVRLSTSFGEVAEVPVYARDWLSDLALIGPMPFDELSGEIPTVDFGSSATVEIGDNVYLIGYPGEVESQPEPAMTSGTLSRRRLASCLGLTFLQTDAMIAGGQSGGALVDTAGQLIGLSGLGGFTESNFALVLAAEDVSAVLAGLDEGSGSLSKPEGSGALRQSARIDVSDSAGYLVTVTEEQPVLSVTANSPEGEDVWLSIDTWDGLIPWWHWSQDEVDYMWDDLYALDEGASDLFYMDAFDDGTMESLEVSLWPGVYVISTGSFSYSSTEVSVEASSPLRLVEDVESPGGKLTPGKSVTGAINHIQDVDSYRIDLQKGDTVRIQMVSISDPVMSLYRNDFLVASNDDAGIGLYGDGAEIVFEAKTTGQYDLYVGVLQTSPGPYVLTLDPADTDSPTC
jgi:S1-C subfamily serine protease